MIDVFHNCFYTDVPAFIRIYPFSPETKYLDGYGKKSCRLTIIKTRQEVESSSIQELLEKLSISRYRLKKWVKEKKAKLEILN